MNHYEFTSGFKSLYDKAVSFYINGRRDALTYYSSEEVDWLSKNGITSQHMYDYAEDHCNYQEPGFEQALAIELVRRDYYLNVQLGIASVNVLKESELPSKSDSLQGIVWLPRLLPKARAKLRGELSRELMYCCGGDRKFFKTHNIMPAEFLTVLWREGNNDESVANWVNHRINK
jgi:Domain of unknown function (DUF5069)